MNYRRLQLGMLIVSLLLHGLLWWQSLQRFYSVSYWPRRYDGPAYLAYVHAGTVGLMLGSEMRFMSREDYHPLPFRDHLRLPQSVSLSDFHAGHSDADHATFSSMGWPFEAYHPTGHLRLGTAMIPEYPAGRSGYFLEIPLWLCWFVLTGFSYLLTRGGVMRLAAIEERQLAEAESTK